MAGGWPATSLDVNPASATRAAAASEATLRKTADRLPRRGLLRGAVAEPSLILLALHTPAVSVSQGASARFGQLINTAAGARVGTQGRTVIRNSPFAQRATWGS